MGGKRKSATEKIFEHQRLLEQAAAILPSMTRQQLKRFITKKTKVQTQEQK